MDQLKLKKRNVEALIQEAVIKELRYRLWFVKETHGNMYSSGFPDLFCCHTRYGHRWVDCKDPKRGHGSSLFTPAQLETFPLLCAAGSKVWIATSHEGIEELLMRPSNWHMFLL